MPAVRLHLHPSGLEGQRVVYAVLAEVPGHCDALLRMRAVSHYMVFEPVYPIPGCHRHRPASREDIVVEHKPVQGEHAVGMGHCVVVVVCELPPPPVKRAEQALASLFKGCRILPWVYIHLDRRVIVECVPHQGQYSVPAAHRIGENIGDVRGDSYPAPVHSFLPSHLEGHPAGV